MTTIIQKQFKEIKIYDDNPFPDDNDKECRFKKLNIIQENLSDNIKSIFENLNLINPFLFDLYYMNYIIKDEQICKNLFKR